MILYRPVGKFELELIKKSDFELFPLRLAEQPLFYPVINEKYATEIAEKWNAKDIHSGKEGHVTRFIVDDDYMSQFMVKQVGDTYHLEYWIPSFKLDEFNQHIIGKIEVINSFIGSEEA